MISAISENIVIVLLTVLGLFRCESPLFFLMAASVIMMLVTYQSFLDEYDRRMTAVSLVLMTVYAVLSGNFTGFLVFFFLKDVKMYLRVFIGTVLFLFVELVIYQHISGAMCLLLTIFLILSFILLMLFYSMIQRTEERRANEKERIIASNISEMHEKRLNEQLVMQNVETSCVCI